MKRILCCIRGHKYQMSFNGLLNLRICNILDKCKTCGKKRIEASM